MAKNFLIIDCGCKNFDQGGKLNHFLSDIAMGELQHLGHSVEMTILDEPWEIAAEVEKIKKADVIIVQTPGWWMGPPWKFKFYQDQVFIQPGIVHNDGRTHEEPTKNYGRGGTLTDKQYLLSSTWNAPKEAFTEPGEFFEGRGIDGVFFPVHKAFQFLGMKPLPSFMCNDVIKNPKIEEDVERWKAHLKKLFG